MTMNCTRGTGSPKKNLVGLLLLALLIGQDVLAVRRTCDGYARIMDLKVNQTTETKTCGQIQEEMRAILKNKAPSNAKSSMTHGMAALRQAHLVLTVVENRRECLRNREFLSEMNDNLKLAASQPGLGQSSVNFINEAMSSLESTLKGNKGPPNKNQVKALVKDVGQKVNLGVLQMVAQTNGETLSDHMVQSVMKKSKGLAKTELAEDDNVGEIVPLDDSGVVVLKRLLEFYDTFLKDSLMAVASDISKAPKPEIARAGLRARIRKEFPGLKEEKIDELSKLEDWVQMSRVACKKSSNRLRKETCPKERNKVKRIRKCVDKAKEACGRTEGCTGIQVKNGGKLLSKDLKWYLIRDITKCKAAIKTDGIVSLDHLASPTYNFRQKVLHEASGFYEKVLSEARKQAGRLVNDAFTSGKGLQQIIPGLEDSLNTNQSLLQIGATSLLGLGDQKNHSLQDQTSITADFDTSSLAITQESNTVGFGSWMKWWLHMLSWLCIGFPLTMVSIAILIPFRLLAALIDFGHYTAVGFDRGTGYIEGIVSVIFDGIGQLLATIYATLRCFLTGLLKALGHILIVCWGWEATEELCRMSFFDCLYRVIFKYNEFAVGNPGGHGFLNGMGFAMYGSHGSMRTFMSQASRFPWGLGVLAAAAGESEYDF